MKQQAFILFQVMILVTLCTTCLPLRAQRDSVAQGVTLRDVTVKSYRNRSGLRTDERGGVVWNLKVMNELPKILGNADPIHYTQMLPHIQTNAEYRSGVNIQGCESSHSLLTIGGIPLYNVNHLLGFFSTFNAAHYPTLTLHKGVNDAVSANRLGGELTMNLPTAIPEKANGEFSAGLISSQGTLRLPLGKRTALFTSLRGSYLNLLYGGWLKSDEMDIRYSFYDSNVTLLHRLNNRQTLTFDYYGGEDRGRFFEVDHAMNTRARWGNHLGAIHHHYKNAEGMEVLNSLYLTHYSNRFRLKMEGLWGKLPSSITDFGYKGRFRYGRWQAGVEAAGHWIVPQYSQVEGGAFTHTAPRIVQPAFETSLYLDYRHPLSTHLYTQVGLRMTGYGSKALETFFRADPSGSLTYDNLQTQVRLSYAQRHQFLFQTGFSDMGLPTEFWFPASRAYAPQRVHELTLSTSTYLLDRRYRLTVDGFYKRLAHQVEYTGSLLDVLSSDYQWANSLTAGRGENYGAAILLQKLSGKLTGWIGYTFTQAKRTFHTAQLQGTYPANHERPHEVNAVATYALRKHWSFGATFVYASGTPFTAPVSLMWINGNLISQFGKHNANRLKPYCRLDLSANYKWQGKWIKEQGINLSIYNVTACENQLFYTIHYSHHDAYFNYAPQSFMLRVLPSVSYFCKF